MVGVLVHLLTHSAASHEEYAPHSLAYSTSHAIASWTVFESHDLHQLFSESLFHMYTFG